jgi:hypothetical protein
MPDLSDSLDDCGTRQCKTIIIRGRPSIEGWTAAYHAAGISPRGGASDRGAARMSP